jgi:hypothetical protein
MSALKEVFVRVHFRYDRDRYAQDLEHFARWLIDKGYPKQDLPHAPFSCATAQAVSQSRAITNRPAPAFSLCCGTAPTND